MLSNCDEDEVKFLPRSPITSMADAVALSIDTKMVKPDPAAYSYVLDKLGGIPPENAIFVGDGENQELEGATAAGFGKVGFLRQYVAKTSFHAPE